MNRLRGKTGAKKYHETVPLKDCSTRFLYSCFYQSFLPGPIRDVPGAFHFYLVIGFLKRRYTGERIRVYEVRHF